MSSKIPLVGIKPNTKLDLFYILDNLIVASAPSFRPNPISNNPLPEIVKTLTYHHKYSLILDLRSESTSYGDKLSNSTVKYINIPIVDFHAPPFILLLEIVHIISNFLEKENSAVLVHCKHGKGRTGTIVCAYLMFKYGVSFYDANDVFHKRRFIYKSGVKIKSQIHVLTYWQAYLTESSIRKGYQFIRNKDWKWKLKKAFVYGNKTNLKIEFLAANLGDKSSHVLNWINIGSIKVGNFKDFWFNVLEDVCFRLKVSEVVKKTFTTFSINCIIEYLLREKEVNVDSNKNNVVVKIQWEDMDGPNGTLWKGYKAFDWVELEFNLIK